MSLASHALMLITCLFWAASFIATKVALDSTGPFTVIGIRHAAATICFFLWLVCMKRASLKRLLTLPVKDIAVLFLLSLLAITLHHGTQTVGLQYTTAANASVYAATCPLVIFVIAAIFLKERVTWKKVVGIIVALAGASIVTGIDTLMAFDFTGKLYGDSLVFASIFTWACFTVISKKFVHKMTPLELIASVTFLGTLPLLAASGFELKQHNLSISSISLEGWLAIIFLGVTCSFLANLLYLVVLKRTESQKVGVYLYTVPPLTAFMAVLFINEPITFNLIVGTALVFIGLIFTEKG